MKRILFFILIVTSFYSNAESCITFDDEKFCKAWAGKVGEFISFEYVRKEESVQHWTKMLAFRAYKIESDLDTELSAYMNSIKSTAAMKPDILTPEKSKYEDEVIVVSLLISPNRAYYEHVIHRIYRDSNRVYSGFFSFRMPYAAQANFNVIAQNRNTWIKQLMAMDFKKYMSKSPSKPK